MSKRMQVLPYLLAAALVALFLAPTPTLAFHYPWDQGHDTFQPDPGDDDTDPGSDDGCNSCPCTSKSMSPVEAASGNFFHELNVLRIFGIGPHIEITLSYNSRDMRRGPFGNGWTFPYDRRVTKTTDGVEVFAICSKANGKRERFVRNLDGSYTSPPYLHTVLSENIDGSFDLRAKDGTVSRFNASGRIIEIIDRNENSLTLEYDATGFLTTLTDAGGRTVTFFKGPDGRVANILDPDGRSFDFSYDAEGNLTSYANAGGETTTFEYDSNNNLTRLIDPLGNILLQLTHDDRGRVVTHVDREETWTYHYNPAASQTEKRDSVGNIWTFSHNENGNITRIVDPFGSVETFELDANLNVTQHTNDNGNTTTYTYDELGNPLTLSDALGNVRQFSYETTYSRPLAFIDKRGNPSSFQYDNRGNLIRITDSLGEIGQFQYDNQGQLTGVVNANGDLTTLVYSVAGNLLQVTDPLGNSSTSTFDVLGRILTSTGPEGRTTSFAYDAVGRLVQAVDAAGGVTRYEYDASGNLTAYTAANGARITYEYDLFNRLVRSIDPLGRTTTYSYDSKGNVSSTTDARGVTVTFSYDPLNRLVRKVASDNTVDFTYDAFGNMLAVTDNDSRATFAYDALNRVTEARAEATLGQPATAVAYTYNAVGSRLTMTDPGGGVTQYSYDARSRLSRLEDPAGDVFSFTYDLLNRRRGLSLPLGHAVTYQFDTASRMTALIHQGIGGNLAFDYTYDAAGNRISMTDGAGLHAFEYDALSQLVGVVGPGGNPSESYAYDAVGNRISSHTSATHVYNAASQLLRDDTFDYSYDANGNLITRTDRATGEQTRYSFDAENQLTQIDFPGGTSAAYRYDGLGRRIEKSARGRTIQYIYDGFTILEEHENGVRSARYTHGSVLDEILSVQRGGSSFYFQSDALRSVVRVVDAAGVTGSYSYDTFGLILSESGVRQAPFGFQGREFDEESGLYYFRARYYDPGIGRFLSPDPLRYRGVINPYRFAGNNPVNRRDPMGQQAGAATIGGTIITGLGLAASDGPLPVGDIIGAGVIIVGVGIILWNEIMDDDDAGEASDDSETCPAAPPVPDNPADSPGEDWEWRGNGPPGSKEGSWYNPKTGESLHPDLQHPPPQGPHWDWKDPAGNQWRIPPGGGKPVPK